MPCCSSRVRALPVLSMGGASRRDRAAFERDVRCLLWTTCSGRRVCLWVCFGLHNPCCTSHETVLHRIVSVCAHPYEWYRGRSAVALPPAACCRTQPWRWSLPEQACVDGRCGRFLGMGEAAAAPGAFALLQARSGASPFSMGRVHHPTAVRRAGDPSVRLGAVPAAQAASGLCGLPFGELLAGKGPGPSLEARWLPVWVAGGSRLGAPSAAGQRRTL